MNGQNSDKTNNNLAIIDNILVDGSRCVGDVEVPQGVIAIGEYAFQGCCGLKSIYIPDGVLRIEDYAFSGCKNLKSIYISNSVRKIGKYAFMKCDSLTKIHIPNSVTGIGTGAFLGCERLKSKDPKTASKDIKMNLHYDSSINTKDEQSSTTNHSTGEFKLPQFSDEAKKDIADGITKGLGKAAVIAVRRIFLGW